MQKERFYRYYLLDKRDLKDDVVINEDMHSVEITEDMFINDTPRFLRLRCSELQDLTFNTIGWRRGIQAFFGMGYHGYTDKEYDMLYELSNTIQHYYLLVPSFDKSHLRFLGMPKRRMKLDLHGEGDYMSACFSIAPVRKAVIRVRCQGFLWVDKYSEELLDMQEGTDLVERFRRKGSALVELNDKLTDNKDEQPGT